LICSRVQGGAKIKAMYTGETTKRVCNAQTHQEPALWFAANFLWLLAMTIAREIALVLNKWPMQNNGFQRHSQPRAITYFFHCQQDGIVLDFTGNNEHVLVSSHLFTMVGQSKVCMKTAFRRNVSSKQQMHAGHFPKVRKLQNA